jgi:hypothetical protein
MTNDKKETNPTNNSCEMDMDSLQLLFDSVAENQRSFQQNMQDLSAGSSVNQVDHLDFGLVDSLTLVDCKGMSLIDIEDETSSDEDEDMECDSSVPNVPRLQAVRNRSGVRRGYQDMTFTVKTKS